MDTCRLLQPDPGFYTNTFTLEQHTPRCIRWISSSEADASLTLVTQECYSWGGIQPCYLGRLRDSNNILPGKYQAHDQKIISVLNDRGYMNGVKELMQVDPGCPAFWVPFTAGTDLHDKAVKGGYLADSSTDLYVMRTLQGDGLSMFGYYNPAAAVGYVDHGGVQEVIHMELLFLLWVFPTHMETFFCYRHIFHFRAACLHDGLRVIRRYA